VESYLKEECSVHHSPGGDQRGVHTVRIASEAVMKPKARRVRTLPSKLNDIVHKSSLKGVAPPPIEIATAIFGRHPCQIEHKKRQPQPIKSPIYASHVAACPLLA